MAVPSAHLDTGPDAPARCLGVGGLVDRRRQPLPGAFSERDRRRIAFGPDDDHVQSKTREELTRAWHKSADAAGVVILDTEAVDRDGKRGWIVVPRQRRPKAIRAAREKGRKR